MRKRLVFLLAVVALSAAACGGSDPLAIVNGQEITLDDMVALNPEYDVIDDFEQASFVDDLGLFVLLGAIESTARVDFGIDVTSADVDAFLAAPPEGRVATVAAWQAAVSGGEMTEGQLRSKHRYQVIDFALTHET